MTTLAAQRRQAQGIVYTPASLVKHVLRHTLDAYLDAAPRQRPRLLDPACGDGAFLIEAYRGLLRRNSQETAKHSDRGDAAERIALLTECVFGIDTDPQAVEKTRRRLACLALAVEHDAPRTLAQEAEIETLEQRLAANIHAGDALAPSDRPSETACGRRWPGPGEFQVIVANPPFIGARRIARRDGKSLGAHLNGRYACVKGSCDLYIAFFERICELLAWGGRFGVIVPNRIAVADYARACRELLLTHTLDRIEDISGLRAFPAAAVYPVILCGAKQRPQPRHQVIVARPTSLDRLDDGHFWRVGQHEISADGGLPLRPDLNLESRVPTRALGELATIHSGTTGFAARRIADALIEQTVASGPAWDFITTGNIDRYQVRRGDVRFMRRSYGRPVLPQAVSFLSARKRRLYCQPKIVLAGLCRRPEAAWSEGDLALGVQVYAAADWREDPFFLLAVLNSNLFAFLFRTRCLAKRMAGGYLAINKGQVSRLPIRTIEGGRSRSAQVRDELAAAAWGRLQAAAAGADALERRIDALVYELYGLSEEEAASIDAHIAALDGAAHLA